MRLRTYLGILLGLLAVVAASFLTTLNRELLVGRFQVTEERSIPVYLAVLLVFLLGFLPTVTVLFIQSLERDLSERRRRRRSREAESLGGRFRRAVDLETDGQLERAAALLEEVLTERPEDFSGLLRYGEILRRRGRADEALDVHRRASVLYPQSVALLYQLADDYEATGEEQVATEIHNRILRDFAGYGLEVMRRRRQAALVASAWEEASQWQERIEALGRAEGLGTSERDQEIALGLTYQRGVGLLENDRPDEAAAIFRQLLEREPRFILAGIMLGEAELMHNNAEAAVEAWKRGFKSTGSPVYLQRIEDHFIEAQEPARAIETLRALIAGSDSDLLLRFFLGRLYYRLEMHDEALKVLEGLSEAMDSSPIYHYLLGRIHQRRDHPRRAMACYLNSLQRYGVHHAEFVCRTCGTRYGDWQDRCSACGSWNAVGLDVEEARFSADELGMVTTPVWGGSSSAAS